MFESIMIVAATTGISGLAMLKAYADDMRSRGIKPFGKVR